VLVCVCVGVTANRAGGSNEIEMWGDGWTVVTRDGGRAAQYEHMVVVTDDGCEVLTRTPACEQLVYP
jgi:Xaa-Pro aminopeptidase